MDSCNRTTPATCTRTAPPAMLSNTSKRTNDPDCLDEAQASEIFRQGLSLARQGDYFTGGPMIACAYLMDPRSIRFASTLLSLDNQDEAEAAAAAYSFLDMELLQCLLEYQGDQESYASTILIMYAAITLGDHPDINVLSNIDRSRNHNNLIHQALFSSSKLLKDLHADPTLELRGERTLTRTTIHSLRSKLYLLPGDATTATTTTTTTKALQAIAELTQALQINPLLPKLRFNRASLYANDAATMPPNNDTPADRNNWLLQEFRQVVEDSHFDSRDMRAAYAWIATLLMLDHFNDNQKTQELAFGYVQKSRSAGRRYQEMYGHGEPKSMIEQEMERIYARRVHQTHSTAHSPRPEQESRQDDFQPLARNTISIETTPPPQHHHQACWVCDKSPYNANISLLQCSFCKSTSYCSRDCQMQDWSQHQHSCLPTPSFESSAGQSQSSFRVDKGDSGTIRSNKQFNSIPYDSPPFHQKGGTLGASWTPSPTHAVSYVPHGMSSRHFVPMPQSPTSSNCFSQSFRAVLKPDLSMTPLPKTVLPELEAQGLANRRMRIFISRKWSRNRPRFAHWWHTLPDKLALLNFITDKTIPRLPVPRTRITQLLASGDPHCAAHVLIDFSLTTVMSKCSCPDGSHEYCDQLLHDMQYYLLCWDDAEAVEHTFCSSLVEQGVFPLKGMADRDRTRFLEPRHHDSAMHPSTLHEIEIEHHPYMHCIGATKRQQPQTLLKAQQGRSSLEYALKRDMYRLGIFALILEQFDKHERGLPIHMPLPRLRGCESCRGSCEAATAMVCGVCTTKWWCSQGCKNASAHGRECPIGCTSKVGIMFG